MSDFLPTGYQVPDLAGSYMKLLDGDNRLRILASPILGNEYWTEDNKPIRVRMGEPIDMEQVRPEKDGSPGKVKHFWAMPVYDYRDSQIKILELTQKGIQKSIRDLASDEDWGSPLNYDLVISRSGEGFKTDYGVVPKPVKKLDPEIAKEFENILKKGFDLNELYRGGNPFSPGGAPHPADQEEIPLADIDELMTENE